MWCPPMLCGCGHCGALLYSCRQKTAIVEKEKEEKQHPDSYPKRCADNAYPTKTSAAVMLCWKWKLEERKDDLE